MCACVHVCIHACMRVHANVCKRFKTYKEAESSEDCSISAAVVVAVADGL